MGLISELVIMNGSEDIAETCIGFSYVNGSNILSNDETYNRITSNGRLLFTNSDRRWTDAILEALDELTITLRDMTVNCSVQSFERNIDDATVVLTLTTRLNYENDVSIDLASDSNEDQLLSVAMHDDVVLSIDNKSAWHGYVASSGLCYMSSLSQFINDFSVYADAHLAEKADGGLVAFLTGTEDRSPSRTLSSESDRILSSPAVYRWRPDWKRNAQRWNRLDAVLVYQEVEYFRDALASSIGNIEDVEDDSFELFIDVHQVVEGLDSSLLRENWAFLQPQTGTLDLYIRAADGGGQERYPFRTGGYHVVGPGVFRVRVRRNDSYASWFNPSNARVRYDEVVRAYYYGVDSEGNREYDIVPRVTVVGTDEERYLPGTAIPMEDSVDTLVASKLQRLSERTTRVSKLVLPLTDQEGLLGIEVGDLVMLNISHESLDLHGEYYVCYIRRDIRVGREPFIEIHVLSHRDITRAARYLKVDDRLILIDGRKVNIQ